MTKHTLTIDIPEGWTLEQCNVRVFSDKFGTIEAEGKSLKDAKATLVRIIKMYDASKTQASEENDNKMLEIISILEDDPYGAIAALTNEQWDAMMRKLKANALTPPEGFALVPIEFVRDAIGPLMDACGNSYANKWLEEHLISAKKAGVYQGETVGNIIHLAAAWEEHLETAAQGEKGENDVAV